MRWRSWVALAALALAVPPAAQAASPVVSVHLHLDGGSADEVERVVTIPLETALNRMPQLRQMRSESTDSGDCRFELEFDPAPTAQTLQRVRELVADVRQRFTRPTGEPRITIAAPRMAP